MDVWIRGGLVVTSGESYRAEIGIENGRIARVESKQRGPVREVIDAEGKWVLPGVIDVHTHLQLPVGGTVSSDDFLSGTQAAACGGVTTILDFSLHRKGASLRDSLQLRHQAASGRAAVDYGFHAEIIDPTDEVLSEIPLLVREGVTSFKLYLAYGRDGRMVDDGQLYAVLRRCADAGALVLVHAENGPLAERLTEEMIRQGKTGAIYHPRSRPNFVEEEAVRRAAAISRFARGRLYIVHLTTREALNVLRETHRSDWPVWAETCPQYLLLDESVYAEQDGIQYIATPPLRTRQDQNALWGGVREGHLSVISTDHCPFTRRQKNASGGRFDRTPSGLPGVETTLSLIYSRGVAEGRITGPQMVAALSTNPAKIFGLYPRKGTLEVGSDADVVIFDPEEKFSIAAGRLHMKTDFSPYEGFAGQGTVVATMLRGVIIAREGGYCGPPGAGTFLPRRTFEKQFEQQERRLWEQGPTS